ncbi:MAG: serpin family protein [Armatimonadetes bacterium]|nr:serpin family protein [Armatimonadota bacterium]
MNKRHFLWVLVALVLASIFGLRHLRARSTMGCSIPVNKKLVFANTGFAVQLFKDVTTEHGDRNILISPCGASLALTLAYNGALGDTRQAMGISLGLNRMNPSEINKSVAELMANLENPGAGVRLAVANAVWISKRAPIVPYFVDTAKKYYKAEASNLDFTDPSAASIINKWVRQETGGLIDNIAEGLDDLTMLCLTNAVYFKGVWTHRFDKEQTHDMPFVLANGNVKRVPMMWQNGTFRYYQANGFDALALPYGSGRINMYVFLPNKNSSLSAFLSDLSAKNWEKWMSGFQGTRLRVFLPRWKLECQTSLREPCTRLGMGIAFDPDQSNFRGLCTCDDRNNVYISVLKQKAFVEVNEEGTEAAAATFGLFRARSVPPEFRASRPFFYAIRDDRTGEILFMGSIVDPMLSGGAS